MSAAGAGTPAASATGAGAPAGSAAGPGTPAGSAASAGAPTATLYAFEHLQASAPPDPHAPRQMLERAHAEADAIREQARGEGFQQGLAEGQEQGRSAAQAAAAALSQALDHVLAQREQMTVALAHDAVELALELAAKIVHGAIESQPERILDVVGDALRPIADRRRLTILVDPADLELVGSSLDQLRGQSGGIELCEVQADRRVGRGGAIVRTTEGEVDATVATQLEKAREVIVAELGVRPAP